MISQGRALSALPATGALFGLARSLLIYSAATWRSTAVSRPTAISAPLLLPIWKSTGTPHNERSDGTLLGVGDFNAASAAQRHQLDANTRKFRPDRNGLSR